MALIAGLGLSGCSTIIHNELHRTLGEEGVVADRFMPATTPEMLTYRATTVFAMLADVAAVSAKSPDDQAYLVRVMVRTNGDLNRLHDMLTVDCGPSAAGVTAPANQILQGGCRQLTDQYIISVIDPDLLAIARVALPADKLQKFLSSAVKSDAIGALSAISSATGQLMLEFHLGAGTHRSSEWVVTQWGGDPSATFIAADQRIAAAIKAPAGPGSSDVALLRPDRNAINAMYSVAKRACDGLAARLPAAQMKVAESALTPVVAGAAPDAPRSCNFVEAH